LTRPLKARIALEALGEEATVADLAGRYEAAPSARAADASAVLIGTFLHPVYIASVPSQQGFLYIVEKEGLIRILKDEVELGHPFLDISSLVTTGGERGLTSLAFPPNHDTSGRFYVVFANVDGNMELDEFQRRTG
jgi:hypothetical protein